MVGFCIIMYLHDILVLFVLSYTGKVQSFLHSLVVLLGLCINFPSLNFTSLSTCSLGMFVNIQNISASLPSDEFLDTQMFVLSLLHTQPVAICQVISFWARQILCQQTSKTFPIVSCHSEQYVEYLSFSTSLLLFISFFPSTSTSTSENVSVTTKSGSLAIFSSLCGYTIDATSSHWAFYFQIFGLPFSFSSTWSSFTQLYRNFKWLH